MNTSKATCKSTRPAYMVLRKIRSVIIF